MAGVKISALTGASALDGTEQIPVVQSGATVRSTVSDISGQKTRVTVTASTYTVQPEDDVVEINTGTCTVTLPALSTQQKPVRIIKISSSAGLVTIQRAGSDVISASSFTAIYMELNGEFYDLVPLSTRWDVTAKKATRTVTGNATIALEDTLFVNAATATISTPANLSGEWEVQKISASAGTITINPPAGVTFTRAALSSVTLTSDGDRWRFKPITTTRIDLVDGEESGSGSNGSFLQYADGRLYCEKTLTGLGPISTANGGGYISAVINIGSYEKTFVGGYAVKIFPFNNLTSSPSFAYKIDFQFYLARLTSSEGTDFSSTIIATGRWYA